MRSIFVLASFLICILNKIEADKTFLIAHKSQEFLDEYVDTALYYFEDWEFNNLLKKMLQ